MKQKHSKRASAIDVYLKRKFFDALLPVLLNGLFSSKSSSDNKLTSSEHLLLLVKISRPTGSTGSRFVLVW